MAGRVQLKQLSSSGATTGQVVTFDGSKWAPATFSGGSARPALSFSKTYDPSSQTFSQVTTVLVQYDPASSYQSITPAFWTLPQAVTAGAGQLRPGVRLYWSDNSTQDYLNTSTLGSITQTRQEIRFNKDGLRITRIAFIVSNTSGSSPVANIGEFRFEGEQT